MFESAAINIHAILVNTRRSLAIEMMAQPVDLDMQIEQPPAIGRTYPDYRYKVINCVDNTHTLGEGQWLSWMNGGERENVHLIW